MGDGTIFLILPAVLFLLPFAPWRPHLAPLFSERRGPMVSSEALKQLTLLFLMYFVLFLVPVAGRLIGQWGHGAALATLFIILVSLLVRFKKLGDD